MFEGYAGFMKIVKAACTPCGLYSAKVLALRLYLPHNDFCGRIFVVYVGHSESAPTSAP
jgi:hypothetical protein